MTIAGCSENKMNKNILKKVRKQYKNLIFFFKINRVGDIYERKTCYF